MSGFENVINVQVSIVSFDDSDIDIHTKQGEIKGCSKVKSKTHVVGSEM